MNLEFYIKLREMVSGGLAKMAETARKTTNAIKGTNDTLAQSYDTIKRKISDLESVIGKSTSVKQIREARRELEGLQRLANKSPGNIQGSSGGMLGFARSFIAPLAIAGGLSSVFGAGAKQEQDIVGLRTFLGQKGAEQAYSNIRKDAAATPFSVESLLEVNRALITTGMTADAARKDTMNLANAVAASGKGNEELMRMAANMQQIKNLGVATAIDIKQFGIAGINIYQLLADATGKSIDKVREMDVSYELLSYALDRAAKSGGLFAGALDAQAKTVSGRWSTFKDDISLGAADIGTSLQPLMHGLLDIGMAITSTVIPATVELVSWLVKNSEWLGLIATGLGVGIAAYYAYTFALKAGTIATTVLTGAQRILNFVMAMNPIGLVIAAIAALVAVVIYAWNKFAPFRAIVLSTWEVLKGFGEMIKTYVVDRFYAMLSLAGALGNALKLLFKGEFSQAWDATKAGLSAYGNATADSDKRIRGQWDNTKKNAVTAFVGELKKGDTSDTATASGVKLTDTKPINNANADESVKGIAGGGPRVINININKMVEKIEVHAATVQDGLNDLEQRVEETFLRVLYSGAKVGS